MAFFISAEPPPSNPGSDEVRRPSIRGGTLEPPVLYLLQDGSKASLVLAAGAIAPEGNWRRSARTLADNILRTVDPELKD